MSVFFRKKKIGIAQGKLSALERTLIPTICRHRGSTTIHSFCCSPQAAIVLQLRVVTVDLSNFISLLLIPLPTATSLPPCSAHFFTVTGKTRTGKGLYLSDLQATCCHQQKHGLCVVFWACRRYSLG